jgi:hypothetical protein
MSNKIKQLDTEKLGWPPSGSDPMKTIQAEGAFFRAMGRPEKRPMWMRLAILVFGAFIVFEGASTLFIWLDPKYNIDMVFAVGGTVFSLFGILIGGKIILTNLRIPKK